MRHRRFAPAPLTGATARAAASVVLAVLLAACSGANRSPGSTASSAPTTANPGSATASPTSPVAPSTGSGQAVTMVFGGDTAIRGPSVKLLEADPASVFGPITEQLTGADLALLNLETAITTGPATPEDKEFTFSTGPEVFDALRAAGVDGVSMANNHAVDFGVDGLAQSLDAIDADGFPVVGIGRDEAAAYAPHVFEVNGQRIAVLGTTEVIDSQLVKTWTATDSQPGLSSAKRVDRLVEAVRAARTDADTVVVLIHWGTQYVPCPTDVQLELADALTEAGADIVVGGHQHRVGGAGFYGSALVGYGLGNFLFSASSPAASHSGLLEVTATGRRIDGYRWIPAVINDDAQPIPVPPDVRPYRGLMNDWNALRTCTDLTADRRDG
ncbi:MAG: CapA family protein [Candidatus Microthrix sp.]|nr:CapA family protein [Candidatus Microthrix sp.]